MTTSSLPEIPADLSEIIHYSLQEVGRILGVKFPEISLSKESDTEGCKISEHFVRCWTEKRLDQASVFIDSPNVLFQDGTIDHVSSLVYKVNYIQEYFCETKDDVGRFPFKESWQYRFDSVKENDVLEHFKAICASLNVALPANQKSSLFVSHDNDGLFRGFKQDGLFALRKGRLDWLLRLVVSEMLMKPRWFNMDRIMDINDEYDLRSTFFWLVEKGDVELGESRVRNADYSISDLRIQAQMQKIQARGYEQGLHKAIGPKTFREEIEMLPFGCMANRNHFLRMSVPDHFKELDDSGLTLDFTLGFAESIGLRNGYALPYRPYDLARNTNTTTLFVPLMIMDTTNWTYQKGSVKKFEQELMDFVDRHQNNALISVLWHNKYFTDMKFDGYLSVYKSLLDQCRSLGITGITQGGILHKYGA